MVLDIDLPITTKDHPGYLSIVLYPTFLCNLDCYKCHNKKARSLNFQKMSLDKLKEKIEQAKMLGVSVIIISGGEPTLFPDLKHLVRFLKDSGLIIRLDTNGTNPNKLIEIIDYIDGVALDIKIPLLGSYDHKQQERYLKIVFANKSFQLQHLMWYKDNVLKSIDILKSNKHVHKHTLLRTVKYPLLTNEDIELINNFVSTTPFRHMWLEFFNVEED